MKRQQGQVAVQNVDKGFALVAQESWIQNATVRDNILFHQPYDAARYEAVVWACALTEDLKVKMTVAIFAILVMIMRKILFLSAGSRLNEPMHFTVVYF